MSDSEAQFVDIARLRIGLYIHLDLGWMAHPFSLNSFKIRTEEQIEIIRNLGLERIRYDPARSDAAPLAEADGDSPPQPSATLTPAAESPEIQAKRARRERLDQQRASLAACERQFGEAGKQFKQISKQANTSPEQARQLSEQLIGSFVDDLTGDQEAAIRLLSEKTGEEGTLHALNVTILSLLLGKACGLERQAMADLGMGALLHDIGKIELPDRVRHLDDHFNHAERELYQTHVSQGIALGRRMGLSAPTLLTLAQHHEHADGSGFPQRAKNEKISPAARIVALVNRYDNLCNPANPAQALTPHEVLRSLFAQQRNHFDATILNSFIRMMGVYPPGSVVQLEDERYALVVSVNAARPLKPHIVVHDREVPREDCIVLDLENEPDLSIKRSLKPTQLPRPVFDYLSPRKRMCYFFERGREAASGTPP